MSYHAAYPHYSGMIALPRLPGNLGAPYGLVGADEQTFKGLCDTLTYYGQQDARSGVDPSTGFGLVEQRFMQNGLVTDMTQEQARKCYMDGYNNAEKYTPQQAAMGGLILGGLGGLLAGVLGTLAVQRWL
jgi:hypothetical protein